MTDSFGKQIKLGVYYTAIAKYSGIVISLIVTAILSRLLTPSDFGTIAIATVFIVFFTIISDFGLGAAIVQNKQLNENDIKSIYSFTIYIGIILSVIFCSCSSLIAEIYSDTHLELICQLLSLNILFATLNIVPNGLLLKDKQFKFIAIRTLSIQLLLGVISIISAYAGVGIYTLLINPIGSAILIYIINIRFRPIKISLKVNWESLAKVASYSSYQFAFSVMNYFTRNLDKLLVGRVLGMTNLGYYEKSYRLMLLPVQNLTYVITPALHPVLSDYQSDLKLQTEKYLKLTGLMSFIGFPLAVFLFYNSRNLVLLFFGSQWECSIDTFQILSLTVGLQISGSSSGSYLQASNRTKLLFYLGLINTIINILGLIIGLYLFKTIEGVAWMWVLTSCIGLWNIIPMYKNIVSLKQVLNVCYKNGLICALILLPILLLFHNVYCEHLLLNLAIQLILFIVTMLILAQKLQLFNVVSFLKTKIFHHYL